MKKNVRYFAGLGLPILFLAACGPQQKGPEEAGLRDSSAVAAAECTYAYDHSTTEIFWTAYKFTEKAEVKGGFDSLEVTASGPSKRPQDVLGGATFSIFTASVNSGDAERDGKIAEHFFGAMAGTSAITGRVASVSDGEGQGSASLLLKMNEVERELTATWELDGETLILRSEFSFSDWKADDAAASLAEACKDRHTGTDKISKFWPEGKILVRTVLTKDCG